MLCHGCQEVDKPGLCAACVSTGIRAHRSQLRGIQNSVGQMAKRVQQASVGPTEANKVFAVHARRSRTTKELKTERERVLQANEQGALTPRGLGLHIDRRAARKRIALTKQQLAQRRANLEETRKRLAEQMIADTSPFQAQLPPDAKGKGVALAHLHDEIATTQHRWDEVAESTAQRRNSLVAETIDLFTPDMRPVTAPAKTAKLRGASSTKSRPQQYLSGCLLPRPAGLRGACTGRALHQTNAAVMHFAHCILQLSRCLGLLLPFQPSLVTSPHILASPGRAWTHRYPQQQTLLFDPSAKIPSESSSSSKSSTIGLKPLISSFTSFLTAYTMLLYDLAYICHVHGLPVDLASAPNVVDALLSLRHQLVAVRPSDSLAFKLVPTDVAAFTAIDFGLLLEATISAASASRKEADVEVGTEDEEGWSALRVEQREPD